MVDIYFQLLAKKMLSYGPKTLPFISGVLMSINFLLFWAIPIAGMGQIWKLCLKKYLLPIYSQLDESLVVRNFAKDYVYTKPEHSDFFVMSVILLLNCCISLSGIFYYQLKHGSLPWWMIGLYYCSWVGLGGRMMGAAYALAHKEGHYHGLYKKWLRNLGVDHVFENYVGLFFGNVPWNFSTSHIFIHHRVDGGIGDTFYEWDLDRTSIPDFMLYVNRILLHMTGFSSYKLFVAHNEQRKAGILLKGIVTYWFVAALLLFITKSVIFVVFIYIQPLLCMTYFLALINIGFHGFLDYDDKGVSIPCVNATTIIDGDDDYFGEDDHMAHHYNSGVYFRDLGKLQESKREEFQKHRASVFRNISVVELSVFILLRVWDKLAEHYVDYSGQMTKDQIISMLKKRLTTIEISYEKYEAYLSNPTVEARKAISFVKSM